MATRVSARSCCACRYSSLPKTSSSCSAARPDSWSHAAAVARYWSCRFPRREPPRHRTQHCRRKRRLPLASGRFDRPRRPLRGRGGWLDSGGPHLGPGGLQCMLSRRLSEATTGASCGRVGRSAPHQRHGWSGSGLSSGGDGVAGSAPSGADAAHDARSSARCRASVIAFSRNSGVISMGCAFTNSISVKPMKPKIARRYGSWKS